MSFLLDLPNELLDIIVEDVEPHDIENFTLSCRRLHKLARSRLIEHQVLKAGLRRIESGTGNFPGCHQFPELLELFLFEPRDAHYVTEMIVQGWNPSWEEPHEDEQEVHHCQYSESRLRAFAEAVETTKLIPCEEKEDWISKINVGNENPVIALLLPRLYCLTSLRIDLDVSPESFIFKIVKGIVEAPGSLSLSRLREVKINGDLDAHHYWRLARAFAALPSVVSLTACCLVEESPGSAEPSFDVAPQSSVVQDLDIDRCRISKNAILDLIGSTRLLRSFGYWCPWTSGHPSFAWICGALLQHASTSLEKLSLRGFYIKPSMNQIMCGFQSYTKLRTLTIGLDLTLYSRYESRTADMIMDLLPTTLELLTFSRCFIFNGAWFIELVQCMIKSKERKLPCIEKMNFVGSTVLNSCTPLQIMRLRLEALEAGIELTVEGR